MRLGVASNPHNPSQIGKRSCLVILIAPFGIRWMWRIILYVGLAHEVGTSCSMKRKNALSVHYDERYYVLKLGVKVEKVVCWCYRFACLIVSC
ncbi:hypothetical protein BT69DRAFT_113982 [Atractiella rhizophila]|nr:hypothetical protein BT69DRAFT_113982 [Atractiella rhizophila]